MSKVSTFFNSWIFLGLLIPILGGILLGIGLCSKNRELIVAGGVLLFFGIVTNAMLLAIGNWTEKIKNDWSLLTKSSSQRRESLSQPHSGESLAEK